jgi:hypothetical protein
MSKTLPLSRSLLITGFVAIGIAAAWYMAEQWLSNIVTSALQNRDPYENIYLTVAGEPVLVRTSSGGQTTEKILSLSGDPLNLSSQDLLYAQTVAAQEKSRFAPRAPGWEMRLAATNDGGVPPIYWYLVHDGQIPGHAYGVGFHAPTRTITGYFGRRGFTDSLPPRDDSFDLAGPSGMAGLTTIHQMGQEPRWSNGNPRFLLLADGKLWKIDLAKKQLAPLLDCPQAFRIGNAWRILSELPPQSPDADQRSANSITPLDGLVREPESLVIVNQQTGDHTRYPLPTKLRDSMLSAALLPDGQLLLTAQRDWSDGDEQIVWLKPSGEIAKLQTVHRKTRYIPPSLTWLGWQAAIAAPLPLANAGYSIGFAPIALIQEDNAATYTQALAIVLQKTWTSIFAILVLSAVAAVLAYRRHRRFGLPNAPAWAAFAFLFGPAGWIAYRFHRAWPVLEDCPSCHQVSPRDRETCLDCGALFPPPPQKGIEVFA